MPSINDILISSVGKADFLCQNTPLVCEDRLTAYPIDRRGRGSLLEGDMIKRNCKRCSKGFVIFKADIKKEGGKFCSRKCWELSRRKRIVSYCLYCNKEFIIYPSQIKNNRGKFCSRQCLYKWNSDFNKQYCGERHSCWKGGSSNYYGKIAYNIYKEFNLILLCDICGTTRDICIHHINYNTKDNNINNLRALCRGCHTKLHKKEKYEKKTIKY